MNKVRRARPKSRVAIIRVRDGQVSKNARDLVAGEEPLEIRLVTGGERATVAVTMRTPGNDFELAAGFLRSEGIIAGRDEIHRIGYCTEVDENQHYNVVNVELRDSVLPAIDRLERHFTVTSACGVCGKAHLDAIELRGACRMGSGLEVALETVLDLPAGLRRSQELFGATGGLHAAGLFDVAGDLVAVREDVGRHNAMDKLLGWALLAGRALDELLVCVSGRASFELLQKAVAARIPIFAAVSAPSSLAIAVAERYGVTLIAFLREGRCNVYSGAERIIGLAE